MQQKKRNKTRRAEVVTGLFLILVAFSYITSLLLDFKFVSPNATLQEDLVYLSEHTPSQKISSYSWLATSLITFFAIPFYLRVFNKKPRILHYLNVLFNPASVAVVGASQDTMKGGGLLLNGIVKNAYGGRLYPVNPGESELMGLRSYPTVLDIPGEVDLATPIAA